MVMLMHQFLVNTMVIVMVVLLIANHGDNHCNETHGAWMVIAMVSGINTSSQYRVIWHEWLLVSWAMPWYHYGNLSS